MNIEFSEEVNKELQKIKKKNSILLKKIEKQISYLSENPKHPSLRIHKLSGELKNLWSLSIDRNIRMIYIHDEKGILFIDIGTHDEVYKK